MSRIIGIGTAVPPYCVPQNLARDFVLAHFWDSLPHAERMTTVFEHTQIDTRYFAVPNEWWYEPKHSLKERNDIYIREAVTLGQIAIERALDSANLTPDQIDNLIVVSSTGMATPSLDARLMNTLHLRSDVRRTPIWGLGCAGGVAGLARASEMTRAYPDSITVLLTVELCSLNFQFDDMTKKNFVSTSLFGDGAAAVVVAGQNRSPENAPQILGAQSTLWPDSIDVMGWDVTDGGLSVIFGVKIPRYVVDLFRPEVERLLERHQLDIQHIDHFIFHPGGAKIIDAYDKSLNLTNGHLTPSREILRQYGNMSSPTVLFVLDYILKHAQPTAGQYGLAAALGPGFCAEQLLIKF